MKRIFFLLIFGGFLLNGCSDDMPPKCDSSETKKLLNQVIQQNINKNYLLKQTVSTFKTVGHEKIEEHKNAKEYSCEARIIINYTNGEMDSDLISYSVFSDTSDRSKFYVQITD